VFTELVKSSCQSSLCKMGVLTKAEIMVLYKELESFVGTHPLFKCCREYAVLQMVTHADDVYREAIEAVTSKGIQANNEELILRLVPVADTLAFGAYLSWKYCPPCNCAKQHAGEFEESESIRSLVTKLATFVFLHDLLLMSIAGHCEAAPTNRTSISFRLTERTNRQMQFADQQLAHARPGTVPTSSNLLQRIDQILGDQLTSVGSQLSYRFERNTHTQIANIFRPLFSSIPRFENTPLSRKYTLNEFREVWTALEALVFYHGRMIKPFAKSHPNACARSIHVQRSKRSWVSLIRRLTGFSERAVNSILSDLTYAGQIYTRADHAPFPPFFPTKNGLLLINSVLVGVVPEDELYRLFGTIAPAVQTALKKEKETLQIGRLKNIFASTDIEVYGPFKKVEYGGKKTDLDALVISKKYRTGWCCQLKSPAQVRWRKETELVADDLNKAIDQAETSLGWLSTAPQSVLEELQITEQEFQDYKIYGIVVSSGPLGAGLAERRADIPITNEFVIGQLVRSFRYPDLEKIWMYTKSALLLPVEGIDFILGDLSLELGHYTFIAYGAISSAPERLKKYEPELSEI
jgi:hypothetical protein